MDHPIADLPQAAIRRAIRRTGPGWGIWTATLRGGWAGRPPLRAAARGGVRLARAGSRVSPRQLTRLTTDPPQSRLTACPYPGRHYGDRVSAASCGNSVTIM